MKSPTAEVFIICSKSTLKINPLGGLIEKKCKLGFTHYSIAVRYKGQLVVSEAVWPRPRFVTLETWLKSHCPVFIFRKEIKNQILLFEMMSWMAILCTKSWYSILQLILIYLSLVPGLTKWANSVILNDDAGLVCCEYIIRYLNKFFPEDFEIKSSEDSIGMKEPFEALTSRWVLMDPVQAALLEAVHHKG